MEIALPRIVIADYLLEQRTGGLRVGEVTRHEPDDLVDAQGRGEAARLRCQAKPGTGGAITRVTAEEAHDASVGAAQADEQRERRRLAGAVGAEQRHRLTLLDAERETVERRIAAEALDDGVQHGDGHAPATLSQASSVRL